MRVRAASLLVVLMLCCAAPSHAQYRVARWQYEAGAHAVIADAWSILANAGFNRAIGTYARAGLVAGAGAQRADDTWRAVGEIAVIGRFHFDPFAESRLGLYASGGEILLFGRGASPRVRTIVAVGVEGRATPGKWIAGLELGLGAGARLGVTLRRAREGGR
jgi:hypothetical protein